MRVEFDQLRSWMTAAALAAAVALPVQAQDPSQTIYQLQELLEEVRELRGQVESQQREIENLRRRQRDQYLDLDQRLQRLTGARPDASVEDAGTGPASARGVDDSGQVATPPELAGVPAVDVPEVSPPVDVEAEITPLASSVTTAPRDLGTPTEDEQAAYDRAFRALREQRFADAAEGFSEFLDRYPESGYAPNALYWLAETYYVTRDFETALAFFNQLRDRYPGSNKEGDALLKVGFSHFELRQWNEARAALEQVRSQHPGTTLARLAESRLRDMRLAGHF